MVYPGDRQRHRPAVGGSLPPLSPTATILWFGGHSEVTPGLAAELESSSVRWNGPVVLIAEAVAAASGGRAGWGARVLDRVARAERNVSTPPAAEVGESPLLVELLLDEMARQGQVVATRIGRDLFRVHRVAAG